MSEIESLKAALVEAEKREKEKYKLSELEQLKKDYESKAFATNTFERKSKALSASAIYYEKFYIKDGEIHVTVWSIYLNKHDNFYKPSKTDISYSRSLTQKQLTGQNDYNAAYNLDSGYSYYKHEISIPKFLDLWNCSDEAAQLIKNHFDNKLPEINDDMIRIGDNRSEENIKKIASKIGIEFIDFMDYPDVHNILKYQTLPLFDRQRYIPKVYARAILTHVIAENNYPEQRKIIQNFIDKYL